MTLVAEYESHTWSNPPLTEPRESIVKCTSPCPPFPAPGPSASQFSGHLPSQARRTARRRPLPRLGRKAAGSPWTRPRRTDRGRMRVMSPRGRRVEEGEGEGLQAFQGRCGTQGERSGDRVSCAGKERRWRALVASAAGRPVT